MSSSKLFGAVVILSSLFAATSVMAQPVISEPGYCAQFYPNANCQNKGPGNPYTDPNFHRNQGAQGWSSGETVGMAPKRTRAYRSGSSAARMQ
jgi:ABC-type multidrug transport system permease subunit